MDCQERLSQTTSQTKLAPSRKTPAEVGIMAENRKCAMGWILYEYIRRGLDRFLNATEVDQILLCANSLKKRLSKALQSPD